jgi:uncharacterized protein (DUF433 family)
MEEIVSNEDVLGGAPRLTGTRVGVVYVYRQYQNGSSPEGIASSYEGVSVDRAVLRAARETSRPLLTYARKEFSDVSDHAGVLIATEELQPRGLRAAVGRVGRAYPSLDGVVEFLSDWCRDPLESSDDATLTRREHLHVRLSAEIGLRNRSCRLHDGVSVAFAGRPTRTR